MPTTNRVALVTGGSRGIGREVAVELARAGFDVAVSYRSRGEDAALAVRSIEALGRRAVALQAEMASPPAIEALVAAAGEKLGPMDVLVSNAGISKPSVIDQIDLALWDETIAVNLRAAFLLTQAVIPSMRARRFGRLVYISSTAAQVGGIVGPHYAASKAGLIGLMHGYAVRLAREGITANVVCPALIETEMLLDNPNMPRPEAIPVGRFGRPEEVAYAVAMIVRNSYITGQTIQVNGGMYPT
jgi:3-oxoacyl-[acyl-carrier protein] reductase